MTEAGRPGHRLFWLVLLVPIAFVGCDNDPIESVECEDDTDAVEISVDVDGSVVFDWLPACEVNLLLVEEDASDVWSVESNGGGNAISPQVTYGTTPSGAVETMAPAALVGGTTYEVILFRDLPGQGVTLVGVQEFVR